jgi:hypothetical protein
MSFFALQLLCLLAARTTLGRRVTADIINPTGTAASAGCAPAFIHIRRPVMTTFRRWTSGTG